jgi:hypothetical protein
MGAKVGQAVAFADLDTAAGQTLSPVAVAMATLRPATAPIW